MNDDDIFDAALSAHGLHLHTPGKITPSTILAEGWCLTRHILALKGMEIPPTIEFLIDGVPHIQATRIATLEELEQGIAALEHEIEHPSERRTIQYDQLHKDRDALLELQKRANQGGALASTSVIEALFPDVPFKRRTAAQNAKIEKWLAIRKEEALKIDPETAEVDLAYAPPSDPYGVMDQWESPPELQDFDELGEPAFFARAPGSDIWVWFGDLPEEIQDKLSHKPARDPF